MSINPKAGIDQADISGALRDFTSARTGIVAAAASNQAGATPLTAAFNRVTTVGIAGDSVRLPAAVPGASLVVTNATATSMDVFPATGGVINTLAANAAFAMAANVTVMFVCSVAGTWNTIS